MPDRIKRLHEFRDPLHQFIELNRQQRSLVDSEPFQRLRHIHQLALTSLVYPGATHTRFEHSLGVMHLAGMAFDVVTNPTTRHDAIEAIFPDDGELEQWRQTVTLAALAHDIGHLPFSHAAEKQLLPKGEDHESLTIALIESDFLAPIWGKNYNVTAENVMKLAVGKKKLGRKRPHIQVSDWEAVLSELIVGDAFGVDRMDYLLRDSYHLGVSYGRFDHLKLISSLRILPASEFADDSMEPTLGVEESGLHSSEALLLARYFMYEQVYFHDVRRIYDLHLIEFMTAYYGANGYPAELSGHLRQTDNEVWAAIRLAATDKQAPGHSSAAAIMQRGHFRTIYQRNPSDENILLSSISSGRIVPEENKPLSPAYFLHKALSKHFDPTDLRKDLYVQGSDPTDFPVLMADGRIERSASASATIARTPSTVADYIFARSGVAAQARGWLAANRLKILTGEND